MKKILAMALVFMVGVGLVSCVKNANEISELNSDESMPAQMVSEDTSEDISENASESLKTEDSENSVNGGNWTSVRLPD